jgi:hypothetical protein
LDYKIPAFQSSDVVSAYAERPASMVLFRKGEQKLMVIVGYCTRMRPSRNIQNGLWIHATCSTEDIDNDSAVYEIGWKVCRKWEGRFGPDRVAVDLSDGTPLSISLKRQMLCGNVKYMVHISERASNVAPVFVSRTSR